MFVQKNKSKESRNRVVENVVTQKKGILNPNVGFIDNRAVSTNTASANEGINKNEASHLDNRFVSQMQPQFPNNLPIQLVTKAGQRDADRIKNRLTDLKITKADTAFKKTYVPGNVWTDLDGSNAATAAYNGTPLDAIGDVEMDTAFTMVNNHYINWRPGVFDSTYKDNSPQAKHLFNAKGLKSPTYLTELYNREGLSTGENISKNKLSQIADIWKTPNHDEWMGGNSREKATKLKFVHPAANGNKFWNGVGMHVSLYANAVADPGNVTVSTDNAMEALFAMHGNAGSVHVTLERYGRYGENALPNQRNPRIYLDANYGEDRLDDSDPAAAIPPWATMLAFAKSTLNPYRVHVDTFLKKRGDDNW
jgi:hypothetical protein